MKNAISLPIHIKIITPLHIGDDKGKLLSPYCDYVFSDDERYIHYLDLRKIEYAVMNKNALEEYIILIQSMDNNRSGMDLKRFLTHRLELDINSITRYRIKHIGLKGNEKQHIIPTVKNAGQPYLPGSSLKGAIRTAMLYDWLVCTELGKKTIEEYKGLLEEAVREISFKKDKQKIREIRINIEKRIFKEETLFGNLNSKEKSPEAQHIRVRDSEPIGAEWLSVYALRRINILSTQGKSAIPQVVEAFRPGTELYSEISIRPEFQNSYFDYLKAGDFTTIFQNINNFSKDCIHNELNELNYALEECKSKAFRHEIENLLDFYENMKERTDNGAIFLRLGFGKTINDNSLILALLYGLNENVWHDFRLIMHNIKDRKTFFPVTRAITTDSMPMGWIEIMPTKKDKVVK